MIVRRAALRLTVQYSLVLLGVMALFGLGVALYAQVAFDLELPEASEAAIIQANATLRMGLLVCFGALVVLVPPAAYLLARRTLHPVRRNLEAQQRFVDDASHELRTPIAVAQGELELARMRPRDPEAYRAAIDAALAALGELSGLTDDLLLLAREEPLGPGERIGLARLGERAVLAVAPELRPRVALRVHGAGELAGSPELLVRAVANLLENAGKFSPAAAPIELLIERTGDIARITVADEGPGMPPEHAARAFDRFWRADAARSTPGRGIGLSIVRRIAELHGGRASLQSAPGRGTAVTLELPCVPEG